MPTLRTYAFVLAVPDLGSNVRYFQDVLGFTPEWGDGVNWKALARDSTRVMLGHCPNALSPAATGDHSYFGYVEVDDVDALHAEFAARGAIIKQIPADKEWGRREMHVATPDGHRIMFGQPIARAT
jgi:catechol 2,3-dioxygenase-like lactoylglutathione lyase family enzyme